MVLEPGTRVVIAIDGPSGAGKSTVARKVAEHLGYQYVDSGAFYRAVGWLMHARGVPVEDAAAVMACLAHTPLRATFEAGIFHMWVADACVTSDLRGEAAGRAASAVALLPGVRAVITAQLQRVGAPANVVMEGRDIGTVVFPEAQVKFFLDASLAVRGQRRLQETPPGETPALSRHILEAMATRDRQDQGRPTAPLVQAADAQRIDTTDLTVDEVVQTMLSEIHRVLDGEGG